MYYGPYWGYIVIFNILVIVQGKDLAQFLYPMLLLHLWRGRKLEKSKEMFLLMQSKFNPSNNVEKAIRAWNGGNNYNKKRTQRYFEKVMKELKKQ